MQSIIIEEVGPSSYQAKFNGTLIEAHHNTSQGLAVVRLATTLGIMAKAGLVKGFDARRLNGRDRKLALDAYIKAL